MKYLIAAAILICSLLPASAQTPDEIAAAMEICRKHFTLPHDPPVGPRYQPGWENCAAVEAAYRQNADAINASAKAKAEADRIAADKAKVDAIQRQLAR